MESIESLRTMLIEAARQGRTVHYEDIAPLYGFNFERDSDRVECGRILGEMSRTEVAAGRPMLSAVVVHKGDDEIPGKGFFELAKELGRFRGGDPTIYWALEFKALQDYWKRHQAR